MQNEFLSGAATAEFALSTGQTLALPLRYHDYTAIAAAFPASAARVRALLPSSRLRPVQLVPGLTPVVFAAMEYHRFTDSNGQEGFPYNELAIMIPVLDEPRVTVPALPLLPDRFTNFGYYIRHLPVTTELARTGGVEIWGYPKFLAEISFSETAATRGCRLSVGGKEILTLEVTKTTTWPRRIDEYLYSIKDGELLRTRFETRGQYGSVSFRGGAWYTLGDHPIADELRGLKIGHVALQREYGRCMQALLHAPATRRPKVKAAHREAVPMGR